MASRHGACKRRLQFCSPQPDRHRSQAADILGQGLAQVGSSWEESGGHPADVPAQQAAYTMLYGLSDGSSRTAVESCPEPLQSAAIAVIPGARCDRYELPSPAGHLAAVIDEPMAAGASSPDVAAPAALPAAPAFHRRCRDDGTAAHQLSSACYSRGDVRGRPCSRALPGLAPTTASMQQVRDWLTEMGA